jgi:hypothetical protein
MRRALRHACTSASCTPLARAAAAITLVACASTSPPPGGPPDAEPPRLVRITPDTGAVGVRPPAVVFRFDEVVSERPQGAATLDALFLISPRDGEPRVDWDREAIEVRPRRRWRPNTVYTVTMLPGLVELRSNVRKEGATAVFSTGATIPDTRVTGIAFDWMLERPLVRAFVEAVTPDSTVYVTSADSTGRFTFRHIPAGPYVVRAYADANANRMREPREAYDSATVTAVEGTGADSVRAPSVELLAFVHDTLAPRIQNVTVRDSVTLRVEFDKPLQVGTRLTRSDFALKRGPDSAIVAVALAEPARDAEARAAAEREAQSRRDTTLRQDSVLRARSADSARTANEKLRPLPPNIRPAPTSGPVQSLTPRRDTLTNPRPSRPAPDIMYEVRTAAPLDPGTTYRLTVTGARNLLGFTRPSDRAFTTPKADTSARARGDSTRRDSTARRDIGASFPI